MARKPKRYSIAYLLNRQTAGFRKHPKYPELIHYFDTSPVVKRLRVSSRCYRLLNNATVPIDNLPSFCRTYRIPRDKFWSCFLTIKRDILSDKQQRKEEKRRWIDKQMKSLPPVLSKSMGNVKELELKLNPKKRAPVWNSSFIPSTKKRANELSGADHDAWTRLIDEYADQLMKRYGHIGIKNSINDWPDMFKACIVLGFVFSPVPKSLPAASAVRARYRELSKRCHPDAGGDQDEFVKIKKARDTLLQRLGK